MITKYIGSLNSYYKLSKIALVDNQGEILKERFIPKYTLNYFDNPVIVSRDVTQSDQIKFDYILPTDAHFSFDAIIFYTENNVPLGFTSLGYTVDTKEFQIKTLTINFDFLVTVNEVFINTSYTSDYKEHYEDTKDAHKKLLRVKALDLDQLKKVRPKKSSVFTNIMQSDKLLRYSGQYVKGDKYAACCDFYNGLGNIVETGDTQIVKVEGTEYLVISDTSAITIYDKDNRIGIASDLTIDKVYRNIAVCGTKLYSMVDAYSKGKLHYLYEYSGLIVPNLLTKDAYLYSVDTKTKLAVPASKELSNLLSRTGFTKQINKLLAVGTTTIVYEDTDGTTQVFGDFIIEDTQQFKLDYRFDDIQMVSDRVILIHRTDTHLWYSVEIVPTISGDAVKIYRLGTDNDWRCMSKFARNRYNPMNLSLIMSPCEGKLYKRYMNNNLETVGVL